MENNYSTAETITFQQKEKLPHPNIHSHHPQ